MAKCKKTPDEYWKSISVIEVPDDTRQRPAQPAFWGINNGIHEETGTFHCDFCRRSWIINFPRYDRYLNKTNYIKDAVNNSWPCPGCIQQTLILIEEKKECQTNN